MIILYLVFFFFLASSLKLSIIQSPKEKKNSRHFNFCWVFATILFLQWNMKKERKYTDVIYATHDSTEIWNPIFKIKHNAKPAVQIYLNLISLHWSLIRVGTNQLSNIGPAKFALLRDWMNRIVCLSECLFLWNLRSQKVKLVSGRDLIDKGSRSSFVCMCWIFKALSKLGLNGWKSYSIGFDMEIGEF